MAYIRKRGKKWQAIVRKKGYAPKTKTFDKKSDAVTWAHKVAADGQSLLKQEVRDLLVSLTMGDLLQRYLRDETPKKQSAKSEAYRINNILKRPIAKLALSELTSGVRWSSKPFQGLPALSSTYGKSLRRWKPRVWPYASLMWALIRNHPPGS